MPRIAVITGATGQAHLLQECARSVRLQKVGDDVQIEHWIVVDGPQYTDAVLESLGGLRDHVVLFQLPRNTGAGGWNAHRIYGAVPYLVDADYIAFLDEDNMFKPDHLAQLLAAIDGKEWAFSLREIMGVGPDACESLGSIKPSVLGDYLVDTSCYLLKRQLAIDVAAVWNAKARDPTGKMEVDRALAKLLIQDAQIPHGVSKNHSVVYRLGGNHLSVQGEFFVKGNVISRYDASKPDLYLFHLSPVATQNFMHPIAPKQPLDEWQPTLCKSLWKRYNVINGYACMNTIPTGARVLVTLWHPSALPMKLFKQRRDLRKLVYTVESPNIRHADQWQPAFLTEHFDMMLTYYMPYVRKGMGRFCPHNTHHLDFEDPVELEHHLRLNKCSSKAVAIVLERRDLKGSFTVGEATLECLDPLRERYVQGLEDITCYGKGWEKYENHFTIKIGHTKHRSEDAQSAVDILQNYTFALIVENVNAEGYVSEKFYDALMAGCIPLYYGNPVPQHCIPEDLYVDLRCFEHGASLQAWLSNLSENTVKAWKDRIVEKRRAVLEKVSTQAFATAVVKAFEET